MSTTKLTHYMLITLVTAILALLASCPADNASEVSSTQPNQTQAGSTPDPVDVPAAGATSTESSPAEDVASNPVDEPADEEPADTKEASKDEESDEDTETEEKPPMSKNYRPPKEENERPKQRSRKKKSLVSVEMRLIDAKFNDAEDATLSRLKLEFRANIDRMKRQIKIIELDDINEVVFQEYEFDLCKIEIYPILKPPALDDVGSLGSVELLFEGMFQIRVYLENDELIGIFGIYTDGTLGAAPMEERPSGYRVQSRHTEGSYAPVPYTICIDTKAGSKPERLVTIQFEGGGFGEMTVDDPKGHRYKYRFPVGSLELYDPNEI